MTWPRTTWTSWSPGLQLGHDRLGDALLQVHGPVDGLGRVDGSRCGPSCRSGWFAREIHRGLGYEIRNRIGQWESFEREYSDMIRSAFLE